MNDSLVLLAKNTNPWYKVNTILEEFQMGLEYKLVQNKAEQTLDFFVCGEWCLTLQFKNKWTLLSSKAFFATEEMVQEAIQKAEDKYPKGIEWYSWHQVTLIILPTKQPTFDLD